MKKYIVAFVIALGIIGCNEKKSEVIESVEPQKNYAEFGSSITSVDALNIDELTDIYSNLEKNDTLDVKFSGVIKEVCQKKGCWMKIELANGKDVFVKFKDYDFFVPLNASDSETIVAGKAYLSVQTVDDLRHYAKDAGKSEEEINEISEEKITYAFMADGVLIEE